MEQFKAPRTLDADPDSPLVQGLKEFPGLRVDIIVNLVSPDAYTLGSSLVNAFQGAGWQPKSWRAMGTFPIPGIAVGMAVWDADKPIPIWADARDKFIALLNEAGVAASIGLGYSKDPGWAGSGGSVIAKFVDGPPWDANDVHP